MIDLIYLRFVIIELSFPIEAIQNLSIQSDNNRNGYQIVQQERVHGESVQRREIFIDKLSEFGGFREVPEFGPVHYAR